MILVRRDVAFVKIPRTGGTSMHRALGSALGAAHEPYVDAGDVNRFLGRSRYWGRHLPVGDVERLYPQRFGRMHFVTLIRHPLERLISVYRWQYSKQPDQPAHSDFETFLRAAWDDDPNVRPQAVLHCRPAMSWLVTSADELPKRLTLIPADRPEDYLQVISERFGVDVLPQSRLTNVSPWREPVDVSSRFRAEIAHRYEDDLDLWRRAADSAGPRS